MTTEQKEMVARCERYYVRLRSVGLTRDERDDYERCTRELRWLVTTGEITDAEIDTVAKECAAKQ